MITVVTLQGRDLTLTFECDQLCKYALCEEMPPVEGSKCGSDRDLQCQNYEARISAINALIRRLRNTKKELEEDIFLQG